MVDPDCQSQTWIMAKRLPAGFQLRTANFQECTTHDSTPHGAFRPDGSLMRDQLRAIAAFTAQSSHRDGMISIIPPYSSERTTALQLKSRPLRS
jgi:hypothetical protein